MLKKAINLFLSILWDFIKADHFISDAYIDRKITPLVSLFNSVFNETQINNLSRFFGRLSKELNEVNSNIRRFKNLGPDVLEKLHNEKNSGFQKIAEYVNDNQEVVFEDGFHNSTNELIKCVVDPVYDKIEELEETKLTDVERFVDDEDEIREFFEQHLEDLLFEDFVDFGDEITSGDELDYSEHIKITNSKGVGYDYLEDFINGVVDLLKEDHKKDKTTKYKRKDILELEQILVDKYLEEYYENGCDWNKKLEKEIKKDIKKWKEEMKK